MKKAETTLLTYLIFNPNYFLLRQDELTEDIFTDDINKSIINAIRKVMMKSGKLNVISVSKEMHEENAFDIITELLQNHIYSDVDEILEMLINNHKERKLQFILRDAMLKIESNGWNEASVFLSQSLVQLNEARSQDIHPIKDDIIIMLKHIENNMQNNGLTGIGTGLQLFDNFTGGLQKSDLIILAGRTSMGKTSLALTIARNAAVDFNIPTVIFSLEMSSIQITARASSMESGISSKEILNSKLSAVQSNNIRNSVSRLFDSKLFIAQSSNKITSILSSMMSYILKEKAQLFVVDYLQLVTLNQKGISREQEVGQMARIFKNFAKENNVCIILLSQLKRGQESKNEPSLSDLRDSGQIEEAADIVMFAHRPEYYGIDTFEDGNSAIGKAEIIISKGRNIGLARFRLNFISHLTKFTNETNNFNIQPNDDFIF